MWNINLIAHDSEPKMIRLKPGKSSVGRLSSSDLVVNDVSASRRHAEIEYDEMENTLVVTDLDSTNGTYVNRHRIMGTCKLEDNDVIRIGQVVMHVSRVDEATPDRIVSGTHRFTRDLLLESLDEHAILLYEISRKLNTIFDLDTAIAEMTALIKRSMGIDRCEVVLATQFPQLSELGFPDTAALSAARNNSAEVNSNTMYVPVLAGNKTLALLCMSKGNSKTRSFNRRDLQLAIAISHQTGLTLQRMYLLDRVRKQERVQELLQRFLSPSEANFMLKDYLKTGQLPPLSEQKVTVLFADIADSVGLAERLGANRFASILNTFYRDAAEVTFKYGGMVKYLGDGVLSVFTQPTTGSLLDVKAVNAARELTTRISKTGHLDSDHRLVVGMTINSGKAMVGYVGTQERAEFSVLGDTVNVAFRMQDYARPYRLLVGPAVAAAIVGRFETRRVGSVSLKGREQPIQVYEVLDEIINPEYPQTDEMVE